MRDGLESEVRKRHLPVETSRFIDGVGFAETCLRKRGSLFGEVRS